VALIQKTNQKLNEQADVQTYEEHFSPAFEHHFGAVEFLLFSLLLLLFVL
jgi:ABC-type cobalt transport system substrate-binding protein